ncbi:MAG: chloride channel protein, partial [Myxococcales bacterium]|nr:chloride channel protein [Myxococcales bacterium]
MALLRVLHVAQHVAWGFSAAPFEEATAHGSALRHILVLGLAGLLAGLGKWLIKHETAGHGGGLNEALWFHAGKLPFFATVARSLLSIIVIGMGAALGREGALKQTGGALASLFCRRSRLTAPERRLLTACGAAAGIAAAYNVPLGGALFALEVLLGAVSVELVAPLLVASLLGAGVARLMGIPQPTYGIPDFHPTAAHVVWACVAAPLFGVIAALYVRWIALVDRAKPRGAWIVLVPTLSLAALGVASIWLPQLLGNGKNTVHATLLGDQSLLLLAMLLLLRPLATGLCLGSGVPGGLFTPTLCIGALAGELGGQLWTRLWPG